MEYLIKEDIVLINKMTAKRHGGNFVPPFNFHNEGSLDYLLEAVQGEMFGQELYPEIADKAAFYMHSIVANHVFQDGNKRTGLEAALLFLKLNGYQLKEPLWDYVGDNVVRAGDLTSTKILIDFTLEVAAGELELAFVQKWFKLNIEKK